MQHSRILFVDDEPNILAAFARHLRREAEVVTACGPEPGIEAIDSGVEFAVVVVDMQMPGMDGIEFLRYVQKRQPNAIRLMLTGNADAETAERASSEVGIFRFLRKPCSADELLKAIGEAVEQYNAA